MTWFWNQSRETRVGHHQQRPSPMITEPSHFAPTERDPSRHWHFLHRSSEATLVSQMGCFRDGAGAGAYGGISLYLLNSLVARPILGKTVVLGFRTLLCTLFCINRTVLSEIFLNLSKINCIYSLDRILCDTCLFIYFYCCKTKYYKHK